jgi:hypothetical protein
MKIEAMTFLVTYKGDLTKKLKNSKTRCPFRLNSDGNTEQSIECFRGGASTGVSIIDMSRLMEPHILDECSQVGQVIAHKWLIMESS